MLNQQGIDIYCYTCLKSVPHKEVTETEWECVNCNQVISLGAYSRYIQIFQETKIKKISYTHNPKIFEVYAKTQLQIVGSSYDHRPVWLAEKGLVIRLNAAAAKDIPNYELEKMFLAALNAIIAYRVKY